MNTKNYMLMLWSVIDPFYYRFSRLICLAERYANNDNILRVRLTNYKGFNVTLSDGTTIKTNDVLVKIHLHNVRIMKEVNHIHNGLQKGKWIYRAVERSLPDLAAFIQEHEKADEIRGIIGITTLNKGCHRLGFETFHIPNHLYRFVKWVTQLPIHYAASSQSSWKNYLKQPNYLFMSKRMLLEKYGSQLPSYKWN